MKRILFTAGCIAFGVLPIIAGALVDVVEEVTITLPSDGTQYTLTPDSIFRSFTVNNSSVDFIMDPRDRVVMRSANRKALKNTLNKNHNCETGYSEVLLEIPASDTGSTTVTVTPSGECGPAGAGGGGGGGGGGSGSFSSPSQTPPTSQTQSQAQLLAESRRLTEQSASLKSGAITADLERGSRGDEVKRLQQLLAKDPQIYPEGIISGFYGPATTKAVQRFQAKYGLPQIGRVGPMTRAKLNEVFGIGETAKSAAAASSPTSGAITRPLALGSKGDDVALLQQVLARDSEVYPDAQVTGFFGRLTLEAVKHFQMKHGIANEGDPGYGRVGPKTRAKLNELNQSLQ